MRTATQWAIRIEKSKEPWAKLVAEIQEDAIKHAAFVVRTIDDDVAKIPAILETLANDILTDAK